MKDVLTPTNLASVVWMSKSHGRAYVIVEGGSDKLVLEQFVDGSRCFVRVAGDKDKVLATLRELDVDLRSNAGSHGAIGIVDADFDHLEGVSSASANVFRTDWHDLECLICRSPAFDKVLKEFSSDQKTEAFRQANGDGIADYLAAQAVVIGCLRWLSAKEQWALRFGEPPKPRETTRTRARDLAFGNFVDRDKITIDVIELVKTVLNHSEKHTLDKSEVANKIRMEIGKAHDRWQVSCGHDFVQLFSIALQKALGSCQPKEVSTEVLERSLRLAYEFAYFKATNLFASIVEWQNRHPTFCVLAN